MRRAAAPGVVLVLPPQCGGVPVAGWDWDEVDGERSRAGTTWGDWHVVGSYDGERFTVTGTPGPVRRGDDEAAPDFSPACDQPSVVDAGQGQAAWEDVAGGSAPFAIPDLVATWVTDPGTGRPEGFTANVVVRPGSGPAATTYVRQRYGGPLCVVERDAPTAEQLATVQSQLADADAHSHLGDVLSSGPDQQRGVVVAGVWLADDAARAYARQRWGDLVQLDGALRPVG